MKVPVKQLLKQYQIQPSKGLGQNFLVSEHGILKVLDAADLMPDESVLEVGPGLGSLTVELAELAKRVITVELDRKMIAPLTQVLEPYDNVEIIQGDILEIGLENLFAEQPFCVVANIPYYITSALIRRLLNLRHPPSRLIMTIQKEVGERIQAKEGKLNLLALSVQVFGTPRIKASIKADSFYPSPKVDSVVIRIDLFEQPRIQAEQQDAFFRLAKAGFGQKRKNLRNSISAVTGDKARTVEMLEAAGIEPTRRAETLRIDEWSRLTGTYLELK